MRPEKNAAKAAFFYALLYLSAIVAKSWVQALYFTTE